MKGDALEFYEMMEKRSTMRGSGLDLIPDVYTRNLLCRMGFESLEDVAKYVKLAQTKSIDGYLNFRQVGKKREKLLVEFLRERGFDV